MLSLSVLSVLGFLPSLALAGISTFTISQPLQCGNLAISWTRSGSVAATNYNLVLIPTSDQNSVLSNLTFTSTSTSYTLPSLPLAKGVEFIALLQDNVDGADGGRVSSVVKVADEDAGGTSCLDNLDHSLDGFFSVSTTTPTQCGDFSITWDAATIDPVGITGLIPGGMSFDVPVTNPSSRTANWPFRVLAGSQVMFAVSDGGAKGSAGSSPLYTVGAGSTSCTNGQNAEAAVIYSSLPVGDVPTTLTVYATLTVSGGATTIFATQSAAPASNSTGSGTSGSTTGNLAGGTSHTGAIAGGVVGGVAGLLIIAGLIWFFIRKKDKKKRMDEKAAQNDMMAAGRPWSPPLPSDPENNPIYQPSPAFFGNGNGNGSTVNSSTALGFSSNGSTHSLSSPTSQAGGLTNSSPSTFSHVPPGAIAASSSGGAGSESEGRHSMEKRGYAAGSSSGVARSEQGGDLTRPGALGEENRRDSVTRFVRHEDAGAVPQTTGPASPDEVVDLPPLYQDAGERASSAGH